MNVIRLYNKFKNVKLVKDTPTHQKIKALRILKHSRISESSFAYYIEEFIETIRESGSLYDFDLLIRNLRKLKIVLVPELENNNMAVYDATYNVIYIDENYLDRIDEIIYHELFHMSSSYKKGKEHFLGFRNNFLFNYFNEGYTEVLTKRYFGKNSKEMHYLLEMVVAEMLEKVIGKDIMERLYSRADSLGLLVEFAKYTETPEITYNTLNQVDQMGISFVEHDFVTCFQCMRNILLVIIKAFVKKCEMGMEKSEIIEFFNMIPLTFDYDDVIYEIFSEVEAEQFKKQCFACLDKQKKLTRA